jgi:ATPase subunit of ABC transporter with duplicated ATPase domains
VSLVASPGHILSLIGPNGAGKTTVLNMIGGFYRPDAGSIRLGAAELAGAPAWRAARTGVARTYQTTQLFADMSEYRRLDGGNGAGEARLEQVKSYRLEPGHAGVYDVGAIHAIDYPEGSRFVRVTGRDLDHVQRLKFDTAAGKAITIESATTGAA